MPDPPAPPAAPIEPDPVLDAVLRAAIEATGARTGWIVVARPVGHQVVAAAATDGIPAALGALVPNGAPSGAAIASGQPSARTVDPTDATAVGAGGARGMPGALLTIPLGDGLGAIELADPGDGDVFGIDEIEVVSLLADVAAAAVTSSRPRPATPDPDDLADGLRSLRDAAPERYAAFAAAVAALLGAP